MVDSQKGKSPFYPGQPVPPDLFVGRNAQIERIMSRGVGQVAAGKPVAMFVEGEYGIGKSSFATYVQSKAEFEQSLFPIYVSLGGASSLNDIAASILESTIRTGILNPRVSEKIRGFLSKYVGEQRVFGLEIHLDRLRDDAPDLAAPTRLLPFLKETLDRVREAGYKGLFLVFDEINGVAADPKFAHFIKGLVDTNTAAVSKEPVPLLLMLCGTDDKRRQMIQNHQPVDRIFDVVGIEPMSNEDMQVFFTKAFESVRIVVDPEALSRMCHYSAGYPKIMHHIGDAAFWVDRDGIIDKVEVVSALFNAAEEVGKKYVDQQILNTLKSADYKSILKKIAKTDPSEMVFQKKDVMAELADSERKKFNNFLQKMKTLNVIRSGDTAGEYVFNVRMVRFYIWLKMTD